MYNHAPDNYLCPFCALIAGIEREGVLSLHSDIIFQDDQVTVFIGAGQWPKNPGNTIIVPNEHFENIYDLPVRYAARIHELVRAVAVAMKAAYHCDGVSTRQHNEPCGGQDVWHYHVHVTPRYQDDHFYDTYMMQRTLMPVEERADHARRLREQIANNRELVR